MSYFFWLLCPTMELVECLSGAAYPERPLALTWEGQRLEVSALLARWRTPSALWFRVRTTDGRIFDLGWDEAGLTWSIQPVAGG